MPARILMIALDGAAPPLVSEWARSGQLPTLGDLIHRGFSAPLEGPIGFGDAPTWATFQTGVSPAVHGRYSYRQFRKRSYHKALTGGRDMKADPFWMALSQTGRRVAVLDVPKSPLPDSLNGLFLSDWLVHGRDHSEPISCPASFAQQVVDRYGPAPPSLCGLNQPKLDGSGYELMLERLSRSTRMKRDLIADVLDSESWDMVIAGFKECHCIGHHAWNLHDPAHPDYDPEIAAKIGDPMLTVYKAVDAAIADLVKRAGPDATAVVFTPLGMGPHFGAFAMLPDLLEGLGYAGSFAVSRTRKFLKALAGSPRHGAGPGGAEPRRRTLRNCVRDALDSRRTCLSIDLSEHVSGLRLNVKGREPNGMIEPGPAVRAFETQLVDDLMALRDLDTGQPLVDRIVLTRDCYDGPYLDDLPDLLVFWNMSRPVLSATSAKLGVVHADGPRRRTGAHKEGGLMIAAGPGISPIESRDVIDLRRLAPTLLRMMGSMPQAGAAQAIGELILEPAA